MTPVPVSRSQLLLAPGALAVLASATALAMLPMTGPTPALWLAAPLAVAVFALAGWVTLRSTYGVMPGLLLMSLVTGVLALVLATLCAAAITLSGWPHAGRWVGGTALLAYLAGIGWAVWRCSRRMAAHDPEFYTYLDRLVDPQHQRVVYEAEKQPRTSWPWASPWLVGAVAVQAYGVVHASGLALRYWLPAVALLLLGAGAMLMTTVFGHGIGVALCLRSMQRQAGQHWVHRDLEQLQALRRAWWLSRWLAPVDPPQLAAAKAQRTRRRHRAPSRTT